jgi:hypothetical protein
MKPALALRRRSSLLADLRILLLGTWGFLCQCVRSIGITRERSNELESGD